MERSSLLDQFLADLKPQNPLDGVPPECQYAVVTLRLCSELLSLAHHLPDFFQTLSEEHFLACLKIQIRDAAFQVCAFCLVWQIKCSELRVHPRNPEKAASDRKERLQQFSEQLSGVCWTLCHAFTPEQLQQSKEHRQYDASVQLGCAWYVLLELAGWCHADIVELLRSRVDKEQSV